MPPDAPKYRYSIASVWRDIAIALAVALLSGWLAAHLELHETVFHLSRQWEAIQLDEWPIAVLAFSVCLMVLYGLRHHQLRVALAENRSLARQALAAQEEERRRLARELHDELGQYLNAIQLDARALPATGADSHQEEACARISENAAHVYGVVSDLVRRLRPAALDELGLVAAVEACVHRVRVQYPHLQVRVSFEGDWEGLPESLNLAVYRIVQESLTNCVRHAGSTVLELSFTRGAGPRAPLRLQMTDQGVGLDPETALAAGGGLAGIRERVQLLGGRFELLSPEGGGATIRVQLPVLGNPLQS